VLLPNFPIKCYYRCFFVAVGKPHLLLFMQEASRDLEIIDEEEPDNGLLTHREIAARLGIGRARVYYLEHSALSKIRDALAGSGIGSICEFHEVPILSVPSHVPNVLERQSTTYSESNGWLKVRRIISLNDGCTDAREVAEAYKLLKLEHEKLLRPPVLVASREGTAIPYRIEAASATGESELLVRCWPTAKQSRSVKNLNALESTAIVESIVDRDAEGEFDVPLLICVIVSSTTRKGL
jgi:hypothetical protein